MAKRVITEADIEKAFDEQTKTLPAPSGECIITAQARDRAQELGIALIEHPPADEPFKDNPGTGSYSAAKPQASDAAAGSGDSGMHQLVQQVVHAMRGKLPAGADSAEVERLVRDAVAARMVSPSGRASPKGAAMFDDAGICFIDSKKLLKQGLGNVPVQEKVMLAEALGRVGESKLAAGYLAWERASFSRVVDVPEVEVVIAGELHLTVGGQTMVGRPGDMIYLPKGAKVIFSTPSTVTLACVNGLP